MILPQLPQLWSLLVVSRFFARCGVRNVSASPAPDLPMTRGDAVQFEAPRRILARPVSLPPTGMRLSARAFRNARWKRLLPGTGTLRLVRLTEAIPVGAPQLLGCC